MVIHKKVVSLSPHSVMSAKDILPNGLSITTREKQGNTTDIGTDPNLGADFPYSVVACGEPRDLW